MIGITGATGFVGMVHLTHAMREGQPVRVLVRDRRVLQHLEGTQVQLVEGDLSDEEALRTFCEGLDTVFHYAARANFKGSWETFETTNVRGTENLLRAAMHVERFIFCSSYSSILEDKARHEEDEGLPYPDQHLDGYGRSKALAEQACLRMHPGATVLRPPWIWGAGDTNNLAAVLRAHARGQLYAIDRGENMVETVHVLNLIHAAVLASQDASSRGKIYFVTDEQPIAHRDFCERLLRSCDTEPRIAHMRYAVARGLSVVDGWMGYKLGMTRSALSYMSRTKTFSDDKIRVELGYTSQVSRAQGLEDLRRWVQHVGGEAVVREGRRRGANRLLLYATHDYLLEGMAADETCPSRAA